MAATGKVQRPNSRVALPQIMHTHKDTLAELQHQSSKDLEITPSTAAIDSKVKCKLGDCRD